MCSCSFKSVCVYICVCVCVCVCRGGALHGHRIRKGMLQEDWLHLSARGYLVWGLQVRRVACCSVLQCGAVWCNLLQCLHLSARGYFVW